MNTKKYTQAITKIPANTLNEGISMEAHDVVDYASALKQHQHYMDTLTQCGLEVTCLPSSTQFPDSCFVEDNAVMTDKLAVITRSSTRTRQGEEQLLIPTIRHFFRKNLFYIEAPGTLDGGDVLQCEDHFFIGLSNRTNEAGANQLKNLLENFGYTAQLVVVSDGLHLKSSVSYLGNKQVIITKNFNALPWLTNYKKWVLEDDESYAANQLTMNDITIIAKGYPKLEKMLLEANIEVVSVDTSEFKKVDGGLSCLSLRF